MSKKRTKKFLSSNRTMMYAEENISLYGQVLKSLGSARFDVICSDSIKRVCRLRGALQKKVRICVDDVVLIALRFGESSKGDIVLYINILMMK